MRTVVVRRVARGFYVHSEPRSRHCMGSRQGPNEVVNTGCALRRGVLALVYGFRF